VVPYRTLHRFATERCGFRPRDTTVRVLDGEPGVECQIDFAQMGFITDKDSGRRRKVHALIFTAVLSRHMFVHLSYSQTLTEVIAGSEAAWVFFGGVFKVLIPDNLKPVVTDADAVNPRLSVGWLDYSQHAGFVTDTARVRSPQDKPKVERVVQYVRGNFFAGETFNTLQAAQHAATAWCTRTAGMRIHGTIAARPLEVFNQLEAVALLPIQPVYDVPILRSVKVHRDYHIEIGKALYSVPGDYIGQQLDALADSQLVKLFHRGQLVKTPTHGSPPVGGAPTPPICPWRGSVTRCVTSTGSGPPRPGRARTSASTPTGCSMTRCRGPGCGPSTGSWAWSAATVPDRSTPPAARRWTSTSSP